MFGFVAGISLDCGGCLLFGVGVLRVVCLYFGLCLGLIGCGFWGG